MNKKRLEQISKTEWIGSILECIKDIDSPTVSFIQSTFGIGFAFAGEIHQAEMSRRRAEKARSDGRIELHLHTRLMAFGSVCSIDGYCRQAKERGAKAIAITDYGSVQSFADACAAGEKYGVKIIYGCEFLTEYGGSTHRVIVLAKNQNGLETLYDMVTESLTGEVVGHDYFLPYERVQKGRPDVLFGLSSCQKSIVESAGIGDGDAFYELASRFDYIEVCPLDQYDSAWFEDEEKREAAISRIVEVALEAGIPVIASSDANCIGGADRNAALALNFCREKAVRGRSLYSELGLSPYRPCLDAAAMLESFSFIKEETAKRIVLDAPFLLAEEVEGVCPMPKKESAFPILEGAEAKIAELCDARLRELFGESWPSKYNTRLGMELRCIRKAGSESIFYACHLIAKKARHDGHLPMCRGMTGNSLVAYLLGITEVDPLAPYYRCKKCGTWNGWTWEYCAKRETAFDAVPMRCPECGGRLSASGHSLPAEMLFGVDGDKVPDFDMAFSAGYQYEICDYLKTLFGNDNVVRAGTIETIQPRTATNLVNGYAEERGREGEANSADVLEKIIGVKRTTGQHPGGFVVLPRGRRWSEFTPLQYPADFAESEWRTTHLPFNELQGSLYKFDLLGNGPLVLLERLLSKIGISMADIDLDDEKLIQVLTGRSESATAENLPEYGTASARRMMEVCKPTTAADLIKVSGLAHGTGTWDFYRDKFLSGEVGIKDEILSNRDDLFACLRQNRIGSSEAYEIAESVRKGRGLSEAQERTMSEHGVSSLYIEACKSVRYLFPKAHIIEYLGVALALAFFKLNHPQIFEEVRSDVYDS